jgi:competence protein ComEC
MRTIVLLLLLLALPARAQELEAHLIALDTHGESILVRTPGGRAVLIDGGLPQGGPQVVEYLRAAGVRELDLVVATHDDPDHVGGLSLVLGAFPVRRFAESPVRAGSYRRALRAPLEQALAQLRIERVELSRGGRLELEDGVALEALAPARPWFTGPGKDDPNGDSLVLRLTHGAVRVLLTGDATAATERRLLAAGEDLRCDVLKVGHHGLDGSSTAPFLAATRARHAVIGCAPAAGPSRAVLERLGAAGLAWYRTDTNGAIIIRSTGAAVTVTAARGRADDAGPSPSPGAAELLRRYARLPLYTPPPGELVGRVGGEVFHRASCPLRRLISSWKVVTFSDAGAARAAGRDPCPLCRPR